MTPECVDALLLDLWSRHVKSKVLPPCLQVFFFLSRFSLSRPSACGELLFDLLLPVCRGRGLLLASSELARRETCLPSRAGRGLAARRFGKLGHHAPLRGRPCVGDEEVLGGGTSSILEVFYDGAVRCLRRRAVGAIWGVQTGRGGTGEDECVGIGCRLVRALGTSVWHAPAHKISG